jgi:hypothetical protein
MTAASRKVAPEGVPTGGAEPWVGGPGAGKPEGAEPGAGKPEAAEPKPSAGKPGAATPRRAPSGPERQRDADRSRRALLDAALEEFSLRGFAGARVADIARRAGVNK